MIVNLCFQRGERADERQEMAAAAALRDSAAKTLGAKLKKRKADDGLFMVGSDWVRPEDTVDPLDPVDPAFVGQSVTTAMVLLVQPRHQSLRLPPEHRKSLKPSAEAMAVVPAAAPRQLLSICKRKTQKSRRGRKSGWSSIERGWRRRKRTQEGGKTRKRKTGERVSTSGSLERERLAVEKRRLDLQEREMMRKVEQEEEERKARRAREEAEEA